VRIVHLCSSLAVESGGVARAVIDSAMALADIGVRVDLISIESGTIDLPWRNNPPANLKLTLVPAGGAFGSRALRESVEDSLVGADGLHLHGMWQPISASAARRARRLHVPYVCSIHGMLDPWSVGQRRAKKWVYYHLIERTRLGRASALHFTAAEEARKARPWLPGGVPEVVIPVILDLAPYRELPLREAAHALFPAVPAQAPWVLFLSRIHEKKGLDILIDAMALLPDKGAQLVIAGAGAPEYVSRLRRQAASLGIASRAHFVGLVNGARKTALYRRADVLAVPTSQENFGMVFPEALACETPVLVTNGVDIHEEILDAGAGLLITRDPGNVARNIHSLLADPQTARQMGIAGRKWVFDNLEPSVIAHRWKETYAGLKSSHGAG
jgi:glycosyltransferase involved in cell wall biosynthesis